MVTRSRRRPGGARARVDDVAHWLARREISVFLTRPRPWSVRPFGSPSSRRMRARHRCRRRLRARAFSGMDIRRDGARSASAAEVLCAAKPLSLSDPADRRDATDSGFQITDAPVMSTLARQTPVGWHLLGAGVSRCHIVHSVVQTDRRPLGSKRRRKDDIRTFSVPKGRRLAV